MVWILNTGEIENYECILCASCADICPQNDISYTF
ncbi:4Fe-4S binding protein [Methanospirillum purgamenti]|uniref:4Fe-4S binding protein n=1 Tax=Methanospirillum hungatei TaxID=2203 RepID=A0A8F5VKA8_METHU|nr:4Fe-4S binding protein [Methanospirillum hungatei]